MILYFIHPVIKTYFLKCISTCAVKRHITRTVITRSFRSQDLTFQTSIARKYDVVVVGTVAESVSLLKANVVLKCTHRKHVFRHCKTYEETTCWKIERNMQIFFFFLPHSAPSHPLSRAPLRALKTTRARRRRDVSPAWQQTRITFFSRSDVLAPLGVHR